MIPMVDIGLSKDVPTRGRVYLPVIAVSSFTRVSSSDNRKEDFLVRDTWAFVMRHRISCPLLVRPLVDLCKIAVLPVVNLVTIVILIRMKF